MLHSVIHLPHCLEACITASRSASHWYTKNNYTGIRDQYNKNPRLNVTLSTFYSKFPGMSISVSEGLESSTSGSCRANEPHVRSNYWNASHKQLCYLHNSCIYKCTGGFILTFIGKVQVGLLELRWKHLFCCSELLIQELYE